MDILNCRIVNNFVAYRKKVFLSLMFALVEIEKDGFFSN